MSAAADPTRFPVPTPQSARRTSRQDDLYRRLGELYLRRGFVALTVDETAAELRCSKSTIYALAPTREELLRQVVLDYFRRAAEMIEARVAEQVEPVDRLEAYLTGVSDAVRDASETFMEDVVEFAPTREVYEVNAAGAARRIRELIEAGVDAGAIRPVRAAFAADLATSAIVRIQQREVRRNTGMAESESFTALADLLLDGLRTRD
ncbi:TetR/AcrR family transcriptional regulator [Agromyces mangrovi Wang et al. 2018]|uniref:TetR/AcrR family transcriptional regulator n=1 Tax=Agromyces mangrovi TaxID=1858653 RepID=UPI0025736E84|nr:TetR/AcrR family transcriptional regulator [Agromyces mangrovi]BDZ65957.1 TetR family transcriptional regulator [Agromyces mangrovi]